MKLDELKELCKKTMPIAKINVTKIVGPAGLTWEITFETHILDNRAEWQRIGLLVNVTQKDLDKEHSPLIELTLARLLEAYMYSRDRISGMATSKKDYADMLIAVMGDKDLHALYQVFGKLC